VRTAHPKLAEAWPRATRFEQRCFVLLRRAYIGTRRVAITPEELAWRADRSAAGFYSDRVRGAVGEAAGRDRLMQRVVVRGQNSSLREICCRKRMLAVSGTNTNPLIGQHRDLEGFETNSMISLWKRQLPKLNVASSILAARSNNSMI
jgi:hypothetical protein